MQVKIPEGIKNVGRYAFYECTGLMQVEIPESVTSIGDSAFCGCTGLTQMEIPESVTSIGSSAFKYCTGLTQVEIPEGVTSIENSVFRGCTGLKQMTIPKNVTSIEGLAFYECTGLKSVEIPESLTSIGGYAFWDCTGIKEIKIPESVISIGEYAFCGCNNLKIVYVESEEILKLAENISKRTYIYTASDVVVVPININEVNDYIIKNYPRVEEIVINDMQYIAYSNHAHNWKYNRTYMEYIECQQDGREEKVCKTCGLKKILITPAHEFMEWTTVKEVGCEEIGVEKRSCERCDYYETKEIATTGHTYEEDVIAPTCEEAGYTTHICSKCGDSYADSEVEALGHKLGEWTTTKEASCTEAGAEKRDCERCDHFETKEVPATGHVYEEEVTEPTCEEEGYTNYTCDVCGDSFVGSEVAALGHSFTDYISDNNATTESAGTLTAKCDHCDATDTIQDPAGPIVPEIPKNDEVIRLSGTTRYETGYKVADVLKERLGIEQFDAVVIATGKNFADALSGSYLAVVKNAPIILTNGKDNNIAALHTYIKENVAEDGKVYILGGEGAVPASVEAIEGYDVVRLSGPTRYDTNLAILEEAGIVGDELIVATGKSFADSLSASAAKLPILLVKPGTALSDEAKTVIEGMNKIYIIGGEGAVSKDIEEELAVYGEVERVFGKSRYETSVSVANTFFEDVEEVVVASGKNFPDGLCGGPLAAVINAPLILTADGKTDAAVDYVQGESVESGFVLGGTGAIGNDSVVEILGLESADEIILK